MALEKYAFSNALALSGKEFVFEKHLLVLGSVYFVNCRREQKTYS